MAEQARREPPRREAPAGAAEPLVPTTATAGGVPSFPYASASDIVRSSQKDGLYLSLLTEALHDAARRVLGPRRALMHSDATAAAAGLLYYGLTTGLGTQTPGEEYCDLLPVSGGGDALECSAARRAVLAVLQAIIPVALRRLEGLAQQHEQGSEWEREQEPGTGGGADTASRQGSWIARLATLLRENPAAVSGALADAAKVHLALFYFSGAFYTWAHRAAGVREIFAGRALQGRPSYRLLGYFLVLQMAASWVPALSGGLQGAMRARERDGVKAQHAVVLGDDEAATERGSLARSGSGNSGGSNQDSEGSRCALCLSAPRQDPTATSCGHVFCWRCIAEWCNQKLECPLCRSEISTSSLVRIYNGGF